MLSRILNIEMLNIDKRLAIWKARSHWACLISKFKLFLVTCISENDLSETATGVVP